MIVNSYHITKILLWWNMERDGKCWKILLQRSTDLILEGERCRDGVPTQTNESGMLTTYRETFGKGAKVWWYWSCHSWSDFGTSQGVNLLLSGTIGRSVLLCFVERLKGSVVFCISVDWTSGFEKVVMWWGGVGVSVFQCRSWWVIVKVKSRHIMSFHVSTSA